MSYVNQLLFYPFLIILRSISPGSDIYNPLRNANFVNAQNQGNATSEDQKFKHFPGDHASGPA